MSNNNIACENMKFKITYILILVFILCGSLSCVSSADNNETCILENNNITYDTDILSMANEDLDSVNNQKIAYCDNTSFVNDDLLSNEASPILTGSEKLYGIVDFGSNVISLNFYKEKNGELQSLFSKTSDSVTAKYKENNQLTQEGFDQLISILDDYDKIMDSKNVDVKYFFATASLRKIDNAAEVIETVKNRLGIDLNVLTGDDEARIGFKAVQYTDISTDSGVLIDLGGGSCEIIIFANETPIVMESMPIGSSQSSKNRTSLFPSESEVEYIRNRTVMELDKLNLTSHIPISDLYGNGGTIFTIKQVLVYLDEIDENTYIIPSSKLTTLLDKLLENTTETYRILNDVNYKRISTLVSGTVITKEISDYFHVEYIHFCKSQLEEGIVYELIENLTNSQSNVSDNNTVIDDTGNTTGNENESTTNESTVNVHASFNIEITSDEANETMKNDKKTILENRQTALPITALLLCLFVIIGTAGNKKR